MYPNAKRLVLTLIGFAVPVPVFATWTLVGGLVGMSKYVDLTTLKRYEDVVQVQELMNYAVPAVYEGQEIFSIRWVNEYHCALRLARIRSYTAHESGMGHGRVLFAGEQASEWESFVEGSFASHMWALVCDTLAPTDQATLMTTRLQHRGVYPPP